MTKMLDPDVIDPVKLTATHAAKTPSPAGQLDLTKETLAPAGESGRGQKKPSGAMKTGALLLAPAILAAVGVGAFRSREHAREVEVSQLHEELAEARSAEAHVKQQLQNALAERGSLEKELKEALAEAKTAHRGEQAAKAVLKFLQDNLLLAMGNPTGWDKNGLGKEATLREAIDAAEAKAAAGFSDQPVVEASVREILGAAYLDLGDAHRAIQHYERALELREADLGADHPCTGDCRNQLAVAYRHAGRADDASRLFEVRPDKIKTGDSN